MERWSALAQGEDLGPSWARECCPEDPPDVTVLALPPVLPDGRTGQADFRSQHREEVTNTLGALTRVFKSEQIHPFK